MTASGLFAEGYCDLYSLPHESSYPYLHLFECLLFVRDINRGAVIGEWCKFKPE